MQSRKTKSENIPIGNTGSRMHKLKELRQQAELTAYEISLQAPTQTNQVYVAEKRQEPQRSVKLMLAIARVLAAKLKRPVQDVFYEICANETVPLEVNTDVSNTTASGSTEPAITRAG